MPKFYIVKYWAGNSLAFLANKNARESGLGSSPSKVWFLLCSNSLRMSNALRHGPNVQNGWYAQVREKRSPRQ